MKTVAVINFAKLFEAFEFVSSAPPGEAEAFLDTETGETCLRSEHSDDLDLLPPDLEEAAKYVAIPHKKDFGLGKPLALAFADAHMPDDFKRVQDIFSHHGAYARFKHLLEHRGKLEQWYEFEATAQKLALRKWCEATGIEVDG